MVVVSAPVLCVPLVAFAPPPHSAEAVQNVALVEVQVKVDAAPTAIFAGAAVNVTAGAGAALAVTVTVAAAGALVPPAPAQVNVYMVLELRRAVVSLPPVFFVPLQPPLAVQPVALVELHVSMAVPNPLMLAGLAVKVAVGDAAEGIAATDTAPGELPPQPASSNSALTVIPEINKRIGSLSKSQLCSMPASGGFAISTRRSSNYQQRCGAQDADELNTIDRLVSRR